MLAAELTPAFCSPSTIRTNNRKRCITLLSTFDFTSPPGYLITVSGFRPSLSRINRCPLRKLRNTLDLFLSSFFILRCHQLQQYDVTYSPHINLKPSLPHSPFRFFSLLKPTTSALPTVPNVPSNNTAECLLFD